MTEPKSCPDCGAEIPADAPEGICRKCLMRLGFENTQRYPHRNADPSAVGTVMLAGLPLILGLQLLLAAIGFDIDNQPKITLHRLIEI